MFIGDIPLLPMPLFILIAKIKMKSHVQSIRSSWKLANEDLKKLFNKYSKTP